MKFSGITSDNKMTFIKHFSEILERCTQKFHHLKILVNKKCDICPTIILQIYKQCVRKIFEYGIVSTITVSNFYMLERERLISVGQNRLARMHANPLFEHTINSASINIAWDKYMTPISILSLLD